MTEHEALRPATAPPARDVRRPRDRGEVAAGLGEAGPLPRRRRQPAREALRADDVPLPLGRPAHGPCRGHRPARRGRAALVAAWLRGAEPDGLGLVRAERRERRDPQRRAPRDVHLRQHRHPVRLVQEVRRRGRLVAAVQHLRPGVLPLDAVAVPAVPRARTGLPQEQPGQLVPERPDGAGQRAGRRRPLRALRRRGDQARADAVVLQDHRLRPGAAGQPGRPGADLAGPGDHRAAQLDRPVRGRARRLPGRRGADEARTIQVYTTRPDTLFGATFMVVAADAALAGSWSPTRSDRRSRPTWTRSASPPRSTGCPPIDPRSGVFLGVHVRNPANDAEIPVYAADYVLPDYGTGAIMAVPGQDQRDWDFATVFELPDRADRPAARGLGRRGLHRRRTGDRVVQQRGRPERADGRRRQGRDHRLAGAEGVRHAAPSTSGCGTGC